MEEPKRLSARRHAVCSRLFLAGQTQAAPFDEKPKAPRAATSQALRTKLEAHFATFERKQQEPDPAAFIRDRPAHQQWSDLYFAVQLAMDEQTPLKDPRSLRPRRAGRTGRTSSICASSRSGSRSIRGSTS